MQFDVKEIVTYQTENEKNPFKEWINNIKDIQSRTIIRKRLSRVGLGNFGDVKSVNENIFELRIDFGPGYRIYFGININEGLVLLLCGGDKSTQKRDIAKAQYYWKNYQQFLKQKQVGRIYEKK